MPNPPHQAHNPNIVELPIIATAKEVAEAIRRDSGVIIKNFVSPETIKSIDEETEPFWKQKGGQYKGNLFNAEDPPLRYPFPIFLTLV